MIKDFKIEAFSKPVSDLADNPLISAGELKAHFDSNSYELLEALNGLIMCLAGDDSLLELKLSGKALDELLEAKVDKADGKGLSEADYTNEEKEKLKSLSNYDDSTIRTALSGKADKSTVEEEIAKKVDKEDGKGLSEANFTNEEKEKLKSLSNYDDSTIRSAVLTKVDKEEGKGLSANDYTDFEKKKIGFIKYTDYTDLEGLDDGAYIVMEAAAHSGMCLSGFFMIQTSYEQRYDDGSIEYVYTQTKYDHDGYIYTRNVYGTNQGGSWSDWDRVKQSNVSVYDTLDSTSSTAALSANMGRELNERISNVSINMGLISEEVLNRVDVDTFDETVGDIEAALDGIIALQNSYIGYVTVTRHYNTCEYYYDEATNLYYLSLPYEYYGDNNYVRCKNMYTAEEDAQNNDNCAAMEISCNVYDADWNLVYSGLGRCRADAGGWVLSDDTGTLTIGNTYYLTRADNLSPINTDLPTHEFTEVSA